MNNNVDNNTNVANSDTLVWGQPVNEEEVKIDTDYNDPSLVNPRFVLSKSKEFIQPPAPAISDKEIPNVTFKPTEPEPAKHVPKKRPPKVEAFFKDMQEQAVDAEQSKRIKQKIEAELKSKIGLVAQINAYCNEDVFPGLKAKANLKKRSYSEDDDIDTLRAAKAQLEGALGMRGAKQVAVDYFGYLCRGIERLNRNGVLFGFNTTGLGDASNQAVSGFDDEINELIVKYQWLFYQPPELRFATKFVKLIMLIDYMNTHGIPNVSKADYKEVSPETKARYEDL